MLNKKFDIAGGPFRSTEGGGVVSKTNFVKLPPTKPKLSRSIT